MLSLNSSPAAKAVVDNEADDAKVAPAKIPTTPITELFLEIVADTEASEAGVCKNALRYCAVNDVGTGIRPPILVSEARLHGT